MCVFFRQKKDFLPEQRRKLYNVLMADSAAAPLAAADARVGLWLILRHFWVLSFVILVQVRLGSRSSSTNRMAVQTAYFVTRVFLCFHKTFLPFLKKKFLSLFSENYVSSQTKTSEFYLMNDVTHILMTYFFVLLSQWLFQDTVETNLNCCCPTWMKYYGGPVICGFDSRNLCVKAINLPLLSLCLTRWQLRWLCKLLLSPE